jgi:hypothetical protein
VASSRRDAPSGSEISPYSGIRKKIDDIVDEFNQIRVSMVDNSINMDEEGGQADKARKKNAYQSNIMGTEVTPKNGGPPYKKRDQRLGELI